MVDPSPTRRTLSRRTLVTGGLAVGAAATVLPGCSVDTPLRGDDTPRPRRPAPDVAVATTALAELRATRRALAATTRRFPGLASRLDPVGSMHRAHEASLVDAVPAGADPSTPARPYAVPRRRPAALRALEQREQELHDRLATLAAQAQSGEFARLLASMGAGVQQRLATWPAS
ncbi:hypothetical protein [Nocardioides aurantiacus]|uniref:Uncharacterized protein n=1 Tax=Nocardioides aurantiacus TaxID=86796 RepID=A0A3N2CX32_9ACTN|nr:hypothetical protein [Nocardioides aurantiacus]ROR92100.1 hypothetical protein EDD33_2984 [Nocardioides aurantiacus]